MQVNVSDFKALVETPESFLVLNQLRLDEQGTYRCSLMDPNRKLFYQVNFLLTGKKKKKKKLIQNTCSSVQVQPLNIKCLESHLMLKSLKKDRHPSSRKSCGNPATIFSPLTSISNAGSWGGCWSLSCVCVCGCVCLLLPKYSFNGLMGVKTWF